MISLIIIKYVYLNIILVFDGKKMIHHRYFQTYTLHVHMYLENYKIELMNYFDIS